MFHNPFNSKIVSDITSFLNEHRNDVNVTPCLAEKAEAAAEVIGDSVVLEDRRNILVDLFNEAVTECGCRGTTKEANDFAKAVEMKLESKKIVVPGKKVSDPSHKDSELAKMGKKIVVPGKKVSESSVESIEMEEEIEVNESNDNYEFAPSGGPYHKLKDILAKVEAIKVVKPVDFAKNLTVGKTYNLRYVGDRKTMYDNMARRDGWSAEMMMRHGMGEPMYRLSVLGEREKSPISGKQIDKALKGGVFAKASRVNVEKSQKRKLTPYVVPGKKTSEPSHKDSELAKMGKKIIVPGK